MNARDLAWFGFGLVVLVGLPFLLADVGDELITTRDPRSRATGESPAAIAALVLGAVALAWPLLRCWSLLTKRRLATVDGGGVRLFKAFFADFRLSDPVVDVEWPQVERIVLWRLRTKLGPLSWWRTRVGVEHARDYYEVHAREPTERQRHSREVRASGVPKHLGSMMKARSVAGGHRHARALAGAAARFAPQVRVVDERLPGDPRVIETAR